MAALVPHTIKKSCVGVPFASKERFSCSGEIHIRVLRLPMIRARNRSFLVDMNDKVIPLFR
jgi:hypothetical protein